MKSSNNFSARPRFLRVRRLKINDEENRVFVDCSCKERTKVGLPCSCFWRIARNAKINFDTIMDVGMFDVRWLKMYEAEYAGDDDATNDLLYDAQRVRHMFQCSHLLFSSNSVLFTYIIVASYIHFC